MPEPTDIVIEAQVTPVGHLVPAQGIRLTLRRGGSTEPYPEAVLEDLQDWASGPSQPPASPGVIGADSPESIPSM